MPHYVMENVLNNPLPCSVEEQKALVPAHKAFVAEWLNKGRVLAAGPRAAGGGGFIILRADSREELDEYIKTDPFIQKGINYYIINEFKPFDYPDSVAQWVADG